jgi:hypothetical protein
MKNNLKKINIFPNVTVYKNLLPYIDKINQIVIDSETNERKEEDFFEPWQGWYHFGTQVSFPWIPDLSIEDLKKEIPQNNYKNIDKNEDVQEYVCKAISSAFYIATMDYVKRNNIELPNWKKMGLTVCKYNISNHEYAMSYHTDYSESKKDEPGYKFGITCTIYLNDDYDGGEILFLDKESKQVVEYKPYAGDVVVFPAGQPIYHGVGSVSKNNKYFIRLYWGWDYEGSKEWHMNKEKYGEETWKEIETKRIKKEFHEGTYHIDVIWNEEEKFLPKYIPNEKDPTLTPFYSPYPKIKMGKGNE